MNRHTIVVGFEELLFNFKWFRISNYYFTCWISSFNCYVEPKINSANEAAIFLATLDKSDKFATQNICLLIIGIS